MDTAFGDFCALAQPYLFGRQEPHGKLANLISSSDVRC